MPAKFELIAPCFFGCESTAKFELTRIGAENIRVEDGRLSFCGGAEMIAAANLNLRTVERVMLLLARYKATTFDELFDGVYSIPWEEFLPADATLGITPQLGILSQGVLIALMFLGRVGGLTLIYAAFGSSPAHSRLPQEKIAIG